MASKFDITTPAGAAMDFLQTETDRKTKTRTEKSADKLSASETTIRPTFKVSAVIDALTVGFAALGFDADPDAIIRNLVATKSLELVGDGKDRDGNAVQFADRKIRIYVPGMTKSGTVKSAAAHFAALAEQRRQAAEQQQQQNA